MTQDQKKNSRFSALRTLRAERDSQEDNEDLQEPFSPDEEDSSSIPTEDKPSSKGKTPTKRQKTKKKEEAAAPKIEGKRGGEKRKVGRPKGRRSRSKLHADFGSDSSRPLDWGAGCPGGGAPCVSSAHSPSCQ